MKTVRFFNKVNGKKTTLISTYENVSNDSDLASKIFKEIGMVNLPEGIDFEQIFNNDTTVETSYFIMEFEVKTPTHKVISRMTSLIEFEGSYSECNLFMNKTSNNSLFGINDEIWDEDGNSAAIKSN